MRAKISIKNYKGERRNIEGEISIEGEIILLQILSMGITLMGFDVDRNTNKKVRLEGEDHVMELDWKTSFKLSGRWKSFEGEWSTTTVTILDIKDEIQKKWWDREDFSDIVETTMITMFESKKNDRNHIQTDKSRRVSALELSKIKRLGPYFSPFYSINNSNIDENAKKSIVRLPEDHDEFSSKVKPFNIYGLNASFSSEIEPFYSSSICLLSNQNDEAEKKVVAEINKTFKIGLEDEAIVTGLLHMSFIVKGKTPKKVLLFDKNLPYYSHYRVTCREEGGLYVSKTNLQIDFNKQLIYPCLDPDIYNFMVNPKRPANIEKKYAEKINSYIDFHKLELITQGRDAAAEIDTIPEREFLWQVECREDKAKVTFGVHHEQLRSLFYFADRGTTKSGRRAALMGWIRSHQRRMKEGTEIKTIPKSLRGKNEFKLHGMNFKITNPVR